MKFVDLFAGIGGFHEAANFVFGSASKCVATCEIDEKCQKFLSRRYDLKIDEIISDVSSIAKSRDKVQNNLPDHDILFGGFPCQPFSNVGKREGLKDSRGVLFFDLAQIIQQSQPKAFLLENVQKIATIEKGETLRKIVKTLKELGYSTSVWDLRASHYGLPQNRRRIFFAGIRGSGDIIPEPPPQDLSSSPFPTVFSLLDRTMPSRHIVPTGSRKTIFERNHNWMGNLAINNDIARPLCASMGKWHRANQDNYFTEDYVYSGSRANLRSYDWKIENLRRITPKEGMRLQGFSEESSDILVNSDIAITTQFKMIGNAVPVNLAVAALRQLIQNL